MGFLGLDETPVKDDNLFQRLFWPSDHAGETDTLGQQGFWVCLVVGVISLAGLSLQGHWILGVFTFLFYGLGGVGVREHSQPAAMLVALAYLLNVLAQVFATGSPPGAIQTLVTLLLLANVRGTWVAAKWAESGDPEAMPERMNQTFGDKLVDQMPARVWPLGRVPFFCIAGLYVVLSIAGAVALAIGSARLRAKTLQPPQNDQTIEVAPSR